jgi:predicted ester cyclase
MIKGMMVAVLLAACGGSQDTTQEPITETPPVDETPTDETPKPEEEAKKEEPPPPPPKKLTLEERIAFHDGCFADFVKESPAFIDRCYTEESSEELVDSGDPVARGKAEILAASKPFWDAFALEGKGMINLANGDNLISVAWMGGTNDGPMMGQPATNGKFGIVVAEVQNLDAQGRHGNVRVYVEMGSMMAQLTKAKQPHRKALPAPTAEAQTIVATGSDAETANVELVKAGFELFNKHDAKGLAAKYAADGMLSQQAMPVDAKGTKAITALFTELFKAFPDAAQQIDGIWGAGDYVVVETTITGTNKGPFKTMGLAKATGKPVKLREVHVFQIADGKAKNHWAIVNGMAFGMQLGLIKPPAPPAAPAKNP